MSKFVLDSKTRELCGVNVRVRQDEFICLNDILYIVDSERIKEKLRPIDFSNFMQLDNIKAFVAELKKELNGEEPYIKIRKNGLGWVHPFFAIKILTHYNPRFEVQVYKWLWDYLVQNRIQGIDSFKAMCGTLWKYADRKDKFNKDIKALCNIIKQKIGVNDEWNKATKEQLAQRDKLHELIIDFTNTFKNSKTGVRYALRAYDERILLKLEKTE